ncbi:coenzyme F420-0:L-glutamate ligase [Sanguibacter sp. A247]|uniref:coenzyme F420-0:L-glutamate ligase n=1 Tax=unclassified Sanguibacter TaxID=2645534 RepID=UPI003FD85B9C
MSGFSVTAPDGIGEVSSGDDLPALVAAACPDLADGDIVVVASKIVSKSEGRFVVAADREDAITAETVRVVAERARSAGPPLRIVENHLGLVMAAAGVDASNTPEGTVLLLPRDPDASARRLRAGLRSLLGVTVGVLVTDTTGRVWRDGLVDLAIGAAGVRVVEDERGRRDSAGRELGMTVRAVADEIAAAADLAKGKVAGRPVAVVRGLAHLTTDDDGPGARVLPRLGEDDLFSEGTAEAYARGLADGSARARTSKAEVSPSRREWP